MPILKKLLFIFAIIALFFCLTVLSYFAFFYFVKTAQHYMVKTAQKEQQEHQEKLNSLLIPVNEKLQELRMDMEDIKKDRVISLSKQQEIQEKLRDLEKKSIEAARETANYQNDLTIQMNPCRDKEKEKVFFRLTQLPEETERFVRSFEYLVFRGYLTINQDELIGRNMSALQWRIDDLKNIQENQ